MTPTRRAVRLLAAGLVCLALAMPAPQARAAPSATGTRGAEGAAQQVRQLPDVTAEGAVLYDPADRRTLGGKAARRSRPMASTTKIMTVLLALEAGADAEQVTVSEHAAEVGRSPGGATLGLRAGQRVDGGELLAALMLRSGNDAAVAIAEHVAGSEAAFTALMNDRAAELGLDATAFVNASGLTDDPGHHASPLDLARLAAVALRDDRFARWAGAERLSLDTFGTLVNRNELLTRYPGATGVKTGYTELAGLSLVASAGREGRRMIAVVLGSQDSFADASRLLDHGFDAFVRPRPLRRGAVAATYRWADVDVAMSAAAALARTVPAGSAARWRVMGETSVERPVRAGTVLGRAELVVAGRVVDDIDLVAADSVPEPAPRAGAGGAGAAVQEALRAYARLRPGLRDVAPGASRR